MVTDGKLRRLSFQTQLTEAVEGFSDWDLDAFLWGDWHGDEVGDKRIKRPGVTFGFHLCRGNQQSRWLVEGGYDWLAQRLFPRARAERLLLEYDDERSVDSSR